MTESDDRFIQVPVRFSEPEAEEAWCLDVRERFSKSTARTCVFNLVVVALLELLAMFYSIRGPSCLAQLVLLILPAPLYIILFCAKRWSESSALCFFMLAGCVVPLTRICRFYFFLGEDWQLDYKDSFVSAAAWSDSLDVVTMDLLLVSFFCILPVRFSRGVVLVFFLPAVYMATGVWAEFLAGHLDEERGPEESKYVSRHLITALRVFLTGLICLGARVRIETTERLHFLHKITHDAAFAGEHAAKLSRDYSSRSGGQEDARRPPVAGALMQHSGGTSKMDCSGTPSDILTTCADAFSRSDTSYSTRWPSPEHWQVCEDELRGFPQMQVTGNGFGVVLKGTYFNSKVAIKVLQGDSDEGISPEEANELRVLHQLRHPHIVAFFGACVLEPTGELALVQEDVDGRTVSMAYQTKAIRAAIQGCAHLFLCGIASALLYLHSRRAPIVHGDLRPCTVMVHGPCLEPKLVDLRLGQRRGRTMEDIRSLRYAPPEALLRAEGAMQPPLDMFSFGRLIFYIVAGRSPLGRESKDDIMKLALEGQVPAARWPSSSRVKHFEECKALSERCSYAAVSERKSAQQVVDELGNWRSLRQGGGLPLQDALEMAKSLEVLPTKVDAAEQSEGSEMQDEDRSSACRSSSAPSTRSRSSSLCSGAARSSLRQMPQTHML
eukprot:TRINITY_DN33812_c0_g1_i1.p1 TRINITY_DN33812_c0_g1~~TRINITY_DN33812_c0_g1_i1.p1  ORF type:complete len:666 (-),score=98.04 TRINITY_DN33812_c0_g1_i1:96-2093(-)